MNNSEMVWRDEPVAIEKPKDAYEMSKNLKKVIVDNELYTNIKGKNYVNVEGWQLAGAFAGIFPVVKAVERVTGDGQEVKYRAEVELVDTRKDKTVGYGVAFCSNKEYSKKSFDEYAIASMAQTRAVGKAYRLTLGWLMKLAGYEATPAEELPNEQEENAQNRKDFKKEWDRIRNGAADDAYDAAQAAAAEAQADRIRDFQEREYIAAESRMSRGYDE